MPGKVNASELCSNCSSTASLFETCTATVPSKCCNKKPHLSSVFPPEMTQDGLRPMCPFLSQIYHSQSLAPVFPLVPLILPVDVLAHKVHLSLTLPVTCHSLQSY